jgi:protein-S-isoprenylcysteine O-methyltransferase Ste14
MADLERHADRPDVLIFPPILLGGTMLLGFVLDWLHPVPLFSPAAGRILGALLFVSSGGLAYFAQAALRRAGTNVSPNQPTLALASDGYWGWLRDERKPLARQERDFASRDLADRCRSSSHDCSSPSTRRV